MAFFKNIKEKLEEKLTDIATIEHVLIVEENGECLYRFQQLEGDSLSYMSEQPMKEEYYQLFNAAFSASMDARTGLTRFIIECIT